MAFVKIEKTTTVKHPKFYDASYTVDRRGDGIIRIVKSGVMFLLDNNIPLNFWDRVNILFDPDTGQIAIVKKHDGEFSVVKNAKHDGTMRISGKDLGAVLPKKTTIYGMEKSNDYDIVLTPIAPENKIGARR